jgi:enoyl-CoA hydratase/carnithine racemase
MLSGSEDSLPFSASHAICPERVLVKKHVLPEKLMESSAVSCFHASWINLGVHACRLTAVEAESAGLVSRVVPQEQLLPEAYKLAGKIASLSAPAAAKAKDCVHRAYETTLSEGLRYEQCALLEHSSEFANGCGMFEACYKPLFDIAGQKSCL